MTIDLVKADRRCQQAIPALVEVTSALLASSKIGIDQELRAEVLIDRVLCRRKRLRDWHLRPLAFVAVEGGVVMREHRKEMI